MANTGAIINDGCPGCKRMIIGMMPQRCFFCGYDFTEAIRAQNNNFQPDPDYKSPAADAAPTEEKVFERLKVDVDGAAEEITEDEFDRMGRAMNDEMDRQRLVQAAAEAKIVAIAEATAKHTMRPGFNEAVKAAIEDHVPGAVDIRISATEVWDPFAQSNVREIIVKLDLPGERILGIEVKKSVKVQPTSIDQ